MKINIETIPFQEMRYKTLGDYWTDSYCVWQIRAVTANRWEDSLLIALHELVEKSLCHAAGIPDTSMDIFDAEWEPHDGILEPGDDPACPYYLQHQAAMQMEKMFAAHLRIDWAKYESRCEAYASAVTKESLNT